MVYINPKSKYQFMCNLRSYSEDTKEIEDIHRKFLLEIEDSDVSLSGEVVVSKEKLKNYFETLVDNYKDQTPNSGKFFVENLKIYWRIEKHTNLSRIFSWFIGRRKHFWMLECHIS